MSREELIRDVIRVYFDGGNWQKYLKQLVKAERTDKNAINLICKDN